MSKKMREGVMLWLAVVLMWWFVCYLVPGALILVVSFLCWDVQVLVEGLARMFTLAHMRVTLVFALVAGSIMMLLG